MSAVLKQIEEVTPEWLTAALHQSGALSAGHVSEVEALQIGDRPGNKWFLLLHYSPDAAGECPPRLFFKLGSRLREAQFYQAAQLTQGQLPVVPCYAVGIDDANSHLLLRDMSATHEARPPSQLPPVIAECEMIVDALADLHAAWWDHPDLQTYFGAIPTEEDWLDWSTDDMARFLGFARFLGDRMSRSRRAMYEQVLSEMPNLLSRRFAGAHNLTLTFEDVHVGNFLYPRQPGGSLYMIDWEQWGISPAPNDLAYMMALFWMPERRSRLEVPLLRRYHERLLANGVSGYSWGDLWYDYRLSVIRHMLVPIWQWAHNGWADVWWNHYWRIMLAFDDLNCAELLG
jgi:hypothetical protein